MISLAIKPPLLSLDLRPVGMLRQLTSLTLAAFPDQSPSVSVDVSILPERLSELTLENIRIQPITNLRCTELRRVFWTFKPQAEEEDRSDGGIVMMLLLCLPKLEVTVFHPSTQPLNPQPAKLNMEIERNESKSIQEKLDCAYRYM